MKFLKELKKSLGKPDFECMVEGHTDSRSYERGVLIDNWDLSVKRATSIVRVLEDLDVNPGRLIAAGRSYYDPLVDNDTPENRATNRTFLSLFSKS